MSKKKINLRFSFLNETDVIDLGKCSTWIPYNLKI